MNEHGNTCTSRSCVYRFPFFSVVSHSCYDLLHMHAYTPILLAFPPICTTHQPTTIPVHRRRCPHRTLSNVALAGRIASWTHAGSARVGGVPEFRPPPTASPTVVSQSPCTPSRLSLSRGILGASGLNGRGRRCLRHTRGPTILHSRLMCFLPIRCRLSTNPKSHYALPSPNKVIEIESHAPSSNEPSSPYLYHAVVVAPCDARSKL